MKFKKTMTILLTLFMMLGLAACGNAASRTEQSSSEKNAAESTANDTAPTESSNAVDLESTDISETQTEETEMQKEQEVQETQAEQGVREEQGRKVLVAYFSATNTTEGVAKHIANGLHADLYEIVPQEPYTEADLDYNDNNSRTTMEMNDPEARPAISGSVENMEQYNIVFVGYPIWWGEAPRIVSTFMENYDFSEKIVVPFCTSGGSGMGSSAANLEQLTSGADWLDGQRLNGSDSQDTVMEWVNSLGLDLAE